MGVGGHGAGANKRTARPVLRAASRNEGSGACDCLGKRFLRFQRHQFQFNAPARAVTAELDQLLDPSSIQAFDRIVQPSFGADVWVLRQWICNHRGPSLRLECVQYGFLVLGRPAKQLDNPVSKSQFPAVGIPNRSLLTVSRTNRIGMADIEECLARPTHYLPEIIRDLSSKSAARPQPSKPFYIG